MKINEIKKIYYDCKVIVKRDENNIPYFVEVIYCGKSNEMSLPYTIKTFIQTVNGWEQEK